MVSSRDVDNAIKELLAKQDGSSGRNISAIFVGGRLSGVRMSHKELLKAGNGNFSLRWSQMPEGMHNQITENLDLEDQPEVDGYLGPMLDGNELRYETQEVYDIMSD